MPQTSEGSGAGRRRIAGWSIRSDDALADAARAGGWWTGETIGTAAARLSAEEPDRVLVVDGEASLDARTLHDRATRLARAFVARGYAPGSVVSFMLPNWHEACVVYLATALAGLVAHPLVTAYREAELAFLLADSGSRMVFVPRRVRNADVLDMVRRVAEAMEAPPEIVLVRDEEPGITGYDALLAEDGAAVALPTVDPQAVRMVIYTSGTTGRPKGVLHTHETLGATVRQLARYWEAGDGAAFLVPSPISHIGGSIYAFEFPILFGTRAVLQESWDAARAVDLIEAHGCTHMAGATPFLEALLAAARSAGSRLPSLRVFVCGGASVPPTLIRAAHDHFENARVMRVFGLTEVPTITVGSRDRADIDHGADTDGMIGIADVRLSETGEVTARGPQMFVGYSRAEDDAGAFDAEGYFRTGDLAELIDGAYLRITGRAKDIIIRQGENIAPKEVEDMLVQHPGIADIAIVGLPSDKTGEMACAAIVPHPGHALDVAALRAFLEERRLAKYKMPERVVLVESLPRNAIGKVLKNRLREDILAERA